VSLEQLGKVLIGIGLLIVVMGGVLAFGGRMAWFGRLPGDIYVERGNWSFYFPLATSVLVSVVLSLLVWLISRR
jgi:hypothetical protein